MVASFIIPVSLMSIFPHQEPRFIIPVLSPLVFLSNLFLKNPFEIPLLTQVRNKKLKEGKIKQRRINKVKFLWYIFNIIFTIFYGFCHQGGVLQLTSHLASELKAKPHLTHIHLVTSYTYPMPISLLHLKNTQKTLTNDNKYKYKLIKDFYIYELGNMDSAQVYGKIVTTLYKCKETFRMKKIPYRIYYALPIDMLNEFENLMLRNSSHKLKYSVIKGFYPHVSFENYSALSTFPILISSNVKYILQNFREIFLMFLYKFQLLLLKIEV